MEFSWCLKGRGFKDYSRAMSKVNRKAMFQVIAAQALKKMKVLTENTEKVLTFFNLNLSLSLLARSKLSLTPYHHLTTLIYRVKKHLHTLYSTHLPN